MKGVKKTLHDIIKIISNKAVRCIAVLMIVCLFGSELSVWGDSSVVSDPADGIQSGETVNENDLSYDQDLDDEQNPDEKDDSGQGSGQGDEDPGDQNTGQGEQPGEEQNPEQGNGSEGIQEPDSDDGDKDGEENTPIEGEDITDPDEPEDEDPDDKEVVIVTFIDPILDTEETVELEMDSTHVMPEIETIKGYRTEGWGLIEDASDGYYKEGKAYKISTSMTVYAIRNREYTINFYNNQGTGTYKDFKKTGISGDRIKLPKLVEKTGYQSLGWATKKGSKTVTYKAGTTITLKKNVNLYAVYKWVGTCTIRFYSYGGGNEYKSLAMKVTKNSKIKLPALPNKLHYRSIGWGTKKSPDATSLKKAGTQITVKKSMRFYGYWKKGMSIRFMNNAGSKEYGSLRKTTDKTSVTITMPTIESPKGYTFLGWSTSTKKSSYPTYKMGQRVTLKKATKLYAVLMKQPLKSVAASQLKDSKKYDAVFFIGDSRTAGLRRALSDSELSKVHYYCRSGRGLGWYKEIKEEMIAEIKATKGKKAIVWNLGINNLVNMTDAADIAAIRSKYVAEMNALQKALKSANCTMYFMSINPNNELESVNPAYGGVRSSIRYPATIRSFNYQVRTNLSGWKYINMCDYLINTGYILKDGLHYTDDTYRKIYYRAIAVLDA